MLGLTADQIAYGVYGLLLAGMGVAQWVASRKRGGPAVNADPVITGIGARLGSDLQMERLIEAVEKIGNALDEKRVGDFDDRIKRLTDQLDRVMSRPSASLGRRPPRREP